MAASPALTGPRSRLTNRTAFAAVLAIMLLMGAGLLLAPRVEITDTEARLLWTVDDESELRVSSASIRQRARLLLDNVLVTLDRTRDTAYPPLYPLLLDAWTLVTGGSLLAARALSTLLVLAGAAFTIACTRYFTASQHPLYSLLTIILIAPLALFAAVHANPLALLFAAGALAHLAFLRWLKKPSLLRGFAYTFALILAFYTHFAGLLLISLHGLWMFTQWRRSALGDITRWMVLAGFAAAGLALWLYFGVREGVQVNIPTWEWIAAALLLALPPLMLIVLHLMRTRAWLGGIMAALLLAGQIGALLVTYPVPPRWSEVVAEINATRGLSEPALTAVAPDSPLGYSLRSGELQHGIMLEIGWRPHSADEIAALIERLSEGGQPIWLIMPADDPETQIAVDLLAESRSTGWQRSEGGMQITRFDSRLE